MNSCHHIRPDVFRGDGPNVIDDLRVEVMRLREEVRQLRGENQQRSAQEIMEEMNRLARFNLQQQKQVQYEHPFTWVATI